MDGAERIINTALDLFGKIDILVNNAGIFKGRMIFNTEEEDWDSVIAVHLKGTYACTRFASAYMRQQKSGRIINVASDAARGEIGGAAYCAAKSGIVGFTYAVARDMDRYGVTCNAIAPLAATRMAQTADDQVAVRKNVGKVVIKSIIPAFSNPSEIAPVVLFLAGDGAAEVTGQVIGVGGGKISVWVQPGPDRYFYNDSPPDADEIDKLFKSSLGMGRNLKLDTIYF
jgi:NAD(P)-dependent dehydrogenase (short-subunit alcohol dehydrogenase family)